VFDIRRVDPRTGAARAIFPYNSAARPFAVT
jgi:hypothetical protein